MHSLSPESALKKSADITASAQPVVREADISSRFRLIASMNPGQNRTESFMHRADRVQRSSLKF